VLACLRVAPQTTVIFLTKLSNWQLTSAQIIQTHFSSTHDVATYLLLWDSATLLLRSLSASHLDFLPLSALRSNSTINIPNFLPALWSQLQLPKTLHCGVQTKATHVVYTTDLVCLTRGSMRVSSVSQPICQKVLFYSADRQLDIWDPKADVWIKDRMGGGGRRKGWLHFLSYCSK